MASMLRAPFRAAALSHCKDFLNITWQDGGKSRFPNIWLRSSVRDPKFFDASGFLYKQKEVASFIVNESPILGVEIKEESEDVTVQWEDHHSSFNTSWLRAKDVAINEQLCKKPNLTLWGGDSKLPINYHYAERNDKFKSWLTDLRTYGLVHFSEVPTKEGLQEVLQCIGQVMQRRHPQNVTEIIAKNKKGVDIDGDVYNLDAHRVHIDTAYYPSPARISGLLCARYSAPTEDTVNFYVDSLKVIEELRRDEPEAYQLLSTIAVDISRRRLTVQEKCEPEKLHIYNLDSVVKRKLISFDEMEKRPMLMFSNKQSGINFSSFIDHSTMKRYYEAYLLLESKLSDPVNHQQILMKAGDATLFNNYRVCHGRSPIHPSTTRTMCLAYITEDTWRSRWRVLLGNDSGLEDKWLYGCTEREIEILADRKQ